MASEKPRIEPLLPPDWNGEKLAALEAFPGGLKFVLNKWSEGGDDCRGMHVLGTMAQYPALAKAFLTFNNHVSANSSLTARDREIMILRTGWLRKSEYEYYQHVILGLRAGLTEEDILRIQVGPNADGWAPEDADLVRAVDELLKDARISDATWARLETRYSQQQMMDMVYAVGCYEIVAMVTRTFNIEHEPGSGSMDEETRARMHGL